MTDEGFLTDILDDPSDDVPRRVYADWLEEHDQADRAALIRVQLDLAGRGEVGPRVAELKARERALLAAHAAEWLKPLKLAPSRVVFRRGFVEEVRLSPARFMRMATKLFGRAPITALRIWGKDAENGMDDLPACEHLYRLTSLRLENVDVDEARIAALLHSRYLAGLATLLLSLNDLTGASVTGLLRAKHLGRVTSLDLSYNELKPGDATRLARSSLLGQLSSLNLSGNDIGDKGVEALAAFGRLGGLQSLGLAYTSMRADALRALLAARLPPLRKLTLGCNVLRDEGARLVAKSAKLAGLRELDLGDCELTEEAASLLASSRHLAGLTMLQLGNEIEGGNAIGDEGLEAIANSPNMANLMELDVGDNAITADGVRALLESPLIRHLYALNLSSNAIGTEGVKQLAASPHAANLHVLGLNDCGLKDDEALALAHSPHLGRFTYLGAGGYYFTKDGEHALRQRFGEAFQQELTYEKEREERNRC